MERTIVYRLGEFKLQSLRAEAIKKAALKIGKGQEDLKWVSGRVEMRSCSSIDSASECSDGTGVDVRVRDFFGRVLLLQFFELLSLSFLTGLASSEAVAARVWLGIAKNAKNGFLNSKER